MAAQLVRFRGVPAWDTVWLEDGPIFVQDANGRDGPLGVVFRSYAGYLQLLPRLLAVPTGWIPVGWFAAYLAVAGALMGSLAGWFVLWCTRGWIASRGVRLALASILVVGPAMAIENTALITNTIWLGFALAPWALLARRDTGGGPWIRAAVLFVSAASTPLLAIFVPLAAVVLYQRRNQATLWTAGGLMAGLALQASIVLSASADEAGHSELHHLAAHYAMRVTGSVLVGEAPLADLWLGIGPTAGVAALALVALVIVWSAQGLGRPQVGLVVLFVVLSIGTYALPSYLRGTVGLPYTYDVYSQSLTRFTVAPIFLLVSAVAVALDPVGSSPAAAGRGHVAKGRVAFLVHTILVVALSFSVTTPRSDGPRWSEEWRATRDRSCSTGLVASQEGVVATSPAGFSVRLPCKRLTG